MKQIRAEVRRQGLPINGPRQILVDGCRQNGVFCAGPTITSADDSTSRAPCDALAATSAPNSAAPDESRPFPPQRTPGGLGAPASDAHTSARAAVTPGWLSAESRDAAAARPAEDQSPPLSTLERARLAHMKCHGEVATCVIESGRSMSRHQMDSRSSCTEVWPMVVSKVCNGQEVLSAPAACTEATIDPNIHPVRRTGQLLRA